MKASKKVLELKVVSTNLRRTKKGLSTEQTDTNAPEDKTPTPAPAAKNPYKGNIENYVGMTEIPTGIAGPLKVNGSFGEGTFGIPLATTEGCLVASYSRGCKAISLAGGANSICVKEGVQRTPLFKFKTAIEAYNFWLWIEKNQKDFQKIVAQSSRFAQLKSVKPFAEGNHLFVIFEYTTGDAAGQNMVTICTQALCEYILEKCPIQPVKWYIEGNFSGDKKSTALSFLNVRGKKVISEVIIPKSVIENILKSTPENMAEYCQVAGFAGSMSGGIGGQGHFANGLAALFLATGQDVACVAEAAVGITRFEVTKTGDLYAAVTLPNLIVGTVGGGTGLPSQAQNLEKMGCRGKGNAQKFAEITGALLLAGELSIIAAIAEGHFTQAHQLLGRK